MSELCPFCNQNNVKSPYLIHVFYRLMYDTRSKEEKHKTFATCKDCYVMANTASSKDRVILAANNIDAMAFKDITHNVNGDKQIVTKVTTTTYAAFYEKRVNVL